MAYTRYYPNGWNNGAAGGTPITPAALDHIEDGIIDITPENIGLAMEFNGTWTLANMYAKMTKVSVPGSALLWLSPSSSGLLSGNKVQDYCTCIASRTNQSNWRFMAFSGTNACVYVWRIEGWSGATATPTIGTLYKLTGYGELILSSQTVDANGNINTGLDAGTRVVVSARCSAYIVTPWVSGSTTTWWAHLTTFTGAAVPSGTSVGTVRVYYYDL